MQCFNIFKMQKVFYDGQV